MMKHRGKAVLYCPHGYFDPEQNHRKFRVANLTGEWFILDFNARFTCDGDKYEMILSCPDCHTRFAVDAAQLTPDGRRVKCGKCAHVWFECVPKPDQDKKDQSVPISVTPYNPGTMQSNLPAVANVRPRGGASVAWMVCSALIATIFVVLWFGRGPIALAVPHAEAIYTGLGINALPRLGEGLEITVSEALLEGGRLVLKGEVINKSRGDRKIPELQVFLSDTANNTLKSWNFVMDTKRLGPRARASFAVQTEDVSAEAANVRVSFFNPAETP
ncbi:MAG: hypothetical protein CL573_02810 [Alphaproteobacteria bacterium]|nr:hypothetical protein [Alphaproteobacteria bacterium]